MIEGLSKSVAGATLVQFRPEQGQERIAPLESLRVGHRQIGEQGKAFGLAQDCSELTTVLVAKLQRSQETKFNHAEDLQGVRKSGAGSRARQGRAVPRRGDQAMGSPSGLQQSGISASLSSSLIHAPST